MAPETRSPASTLRRSTAALVAFWLLLAGALYAGFNWYEQRQRSALDDRQPEPRTLGEGI